jgi:hypothetical protein
VIFKSPVPPKRNIYWRKVLANGNNYEIFSSAKLQMKTSTCCIVWLIKNSNEKLNIRFGRREERWNDTRSLQLV